MSTMPSGSSMSGDGGLDLFRGFLKGEDRARRFHLSRGPLGRGIGLALRPESGQTASPTVCLIQSLVPSDAIRSC